MGTSDLGAMLDQHDVIVCVGSGGVGKTTTAAAIAIAAAKRGRKVAVLTVDPARRLAEALGLAAGSGLDNEAKRLEGNWESDGGELWGSMLDPSATFDDLIREHALSEEQATRVLDNRLYRNLTRSLSGTHEYMAAERLRALHLDERFDLVVVDTPPSQHALDLLDSPGRLARFVDHKLYRSVLAPKKGLMRAWGAVTQLFVRTVSKMIGAALLADVVDFFAAFDGMDDGFRDRASEIDDVLTGESTAYVVVTAPRDESVREARWLVEQLRKRGRAVETVIVNRMTPDFLGDLEIPSADATDPRDQNLRDFATMRGREDGLLSGLLELDPRPALYKLDEEPEPVINTRALAKLADSLLATDPN